ncbi:hypothetical protein ACFDR9_004803 [Janthinobacterium sp. CG_23.3]|uniref:PEP-CTERM sorting domain-containing protein n=1 Tax=Janthinobacterium sp. CG_23.3 TaxID=3349634 RepID=UPI0038D3B6CB
MNFPAGAEAPAGAGLAPAPAPARLAKPGQKTCAQTLEARMPSGGADAAGVSALMRRVLGGADDADMDAMGGPCRLVDGEVEVDGRLNDGVDVAALLEQIAALGGPDTRAPAARDEEALESGARTVGVATRGADQLLRLYLGEGEGKTDPAALPGQDWRRDWERAVDGRRRPQAQPRVPAGLRDGWDGLDGKPGGPAGNLPAVPEPSNYALLLAGLGLLACWRRLSGGRARPAVRR